VADGRSAVLLGVSEQLIGRRALGARGYAWCGNVVPPRLTADERRALDDAARAICAHLATAFALRGLFGVDLVWDGERAWVVEVNPRATGSLETIEAAHGVRAFAAHLEGCAGRLPAVPTARSSGERAAVDAATTRSSGERRGCAAPPASSVAAAAGKAVLFAPADVRVPDSHGWAARGIRDVPHPGEPIRAGHPVCTLVGTGPTPGAVLAELETRAAALRAELQVGVDAVA
jgi:uncharacterized protein